MASFIYGTRRKEDLITKDEQLEEEAPREVCYSRRILSMLRQSRSFENYDEAIKEIAHVKDYLVQIPNHNSNINSKCNRITEV